MQAYSNPADAADPHKLPNVEYWHHIHGKDDGCVFEYDGEKNICVGSGWYYWHCFPGCDPIGPFDTEKECIVNFTDEDWNPVIWGSEEP